ncbi:MAG: hypothetical protein ACR2JC_08575 [Chloroflexota bacterium]
MTRHLQTCQAPKATATGTVVRKIRPIRLLHLVVSGRYAPMYWMHLEAPASATLADLDDFLRGAWLECCGHLSAFTIGGISYASSVDTDWGMDDRGMDVKLGRVIAAGDEFRHEYDFGSTTCLTLKAVSEHEGPVRGKGIEILAQNEPPPKPCDECGQEATQVCSECSYSGGGWLCDQCSHTHECGEEMLLPVVNSPRVGVCGYTG